MKSSRRTPRLTLLMNGRLVGDIRMETSGATALRYDQTWLDRKGATPISLSLPLQEGPHHGAVVLAYLENLLPDNTVIRERVAARVGARGTDAYNLLEKIGRDCVGALQFLAGDDLPEAGSLSVAEGEALSETDIAAMLRNLERAPLGIEDDFRISLAGAQEKTALLFKDGRWFRPRGVTPTTHILKTQIGILPGGVDLTDSVENEFLSMSFCRAMGARTADVEIVDFADQRALVVTRFDRQWISERRILRLPQEDFCQALGVPPSLKYQSDGGPGVGDGIQLLAASDEPTADQLDFLTAQVLFWLLGATDGHAKNFSLAHRPGGFVMTPLYDVLSAEPALVGGRIRHGQYKLAMFLGDSRHYRIDQISTRHVLQSARKARLGVQLVEERIALLKDRVSGAIEAVTNALPADFPTALAETILDGVRRRSAAL